MILGNIKNNMHSSESIDFPFETISTTQVWGEILREDEVSKTFLYQVEPGFWKILVSWNHPPAWDNGKYGWLPHWPDLHETFQNIATWEIVCACRVKDIAPFSDIENSHFYIETEPEVCRKVNCRDDVLIMKIDAVSWKEVLSIIPWDKFYSEYALSILPYKPLDEIYTDFKNDFETLLDVFRECERDEDLLHRLKTSINCLSLIKSHSHRDLDIIIRGHKKDSQIISKIEQAIISIGSLIDNDDWTKTDMRTVLVLRSTITQFSNLIRPNNWESKSSLPRSESISQQLAWAKSFTIDDKESTTSHPHEWKLEQYFHNEARELEKKTIPELFFRWLLVSNGDINYKYIISELKSRFTQRFWEYPDDLLKSSFTHRSINYFIKETFLKWNESESTIIAQDEINFPTEVEQFIDLWIYHNFSDEYEYSIMHNESVKRYLAEEEYSTFYSLYVWPNNLVRKKVSDFLSIPYLSREDGEKMNEADMGRTISRASEEFTETLVWTLT